MGEGLFDTHLIWYSWFGVFELEGKVPSAILELEHLKKPEYINHLFLEIFWGMFILAEK